MSEVMSGKKLIASKLSENRDELGLNRDFDPDVQGVKTSREKHSIRSLLILDSNYHSGLKFRSGKFIIKRLC